MTTTDHEHTPPTEAELDEWESSFRLAANLAKDLGIKAVLVDAGDRLITEVRRLRAERSADNERLDFLLRHVYTTAISESAAELDVEELGEESFLGCDIRDCIDQAMAAERDAARQEPTP